MAAGLFPDCHCWKILHISKWCYLKFVLLHFLCGLMPMFWYLAWFSSVLFSHRKSKPNHLMREFGGFFLWTRLNVSFSFFLSLLRDLVVSLSSFSKGERVGPRGVRGWVGQRFIWDADSVSSSCPRKNSRYDLIILLRFIKINLGAEESKIRTQIHHPLLWLQWVRRSPTSGRRSGEDGLLCVCCLAWLNTFAAWFSTFKQLLLPVYF